MDRLLVCVGGPRHGHAVRCEQRTYAFVRLPEDGEYGWQHDEYESEAIGLAWHGLTLKGHALRWRHMSAEEFRRAAVAMLIAGAMTTAAKEVPV
jgi:hypothetical protein